MFNKKIFFNCPANDSTLFCFYLNEIKTNAYAITQFKWKQFNNPT